MVALAGAWFGPTEERGRRMDGAGMPDAPPPGDPFKERPDVVSVGRRDIGRVDCD